MKTRHVSSGTARFARTAPGARGTRPTIRFSLPQPCRATGFDVQLNGPRAIRNLLARQAHHLVDGAVRAKRAVPLETWWVFKRLWGLRARCYFRARSWAVRWDSLNASVCRRFLCFCFFVAVGQRNEVPPRTGANETKQENPRLNSLRFEAEPPKIKLAQA